MDTVSNLSARREDLQKKIVLAAVAIIALMVLFPPKVIVNRNPILGQSVAQSAGYNFILSDPAAEQKANAKILLGDHVDEVIGSGIEWGKLLLQMVVVVGAAVVASRFLARQQPDGTAG